jgi:hypothetical protein
MDASIDRFCPLPNRQNCESGFNNAGAFQVPEDGPPRSFHRDLVCLVGYADRRPFGYMLFSMP